MRAQIVGGAGGPVLSHSYLGNSVSSSNLTTYSFTSMSLGDPDPTRLIVAVIYGSGSTTASSVTIAGVSATELAAAESTKGTCYVYVAAVPDGTTGTVSVTYAAGNVASGVSLYRLTGYSATAYDFDFDENTNPSFCTVNIAANGVVISGVVNEGSAGNAYVWTDATEDMQVTMELDEVSSARVTSATAEINFVFSVLSGSSGGADGLMAAASFQPSP